MAYAQNGTIEAIDYNGFVSSVNAVWGTGFTGSLGYGQTNTLSTIAATNTVTALQWESLINRIGQIRTHQQNAATGLTVPISGDLIAYVAAISSQIGVCHDPATRQLSAGAQTATSTAMSNATTWQTASTKEITFTWSNGANAMRHFFNSGGYVTFTGAFSNLTGNTKSTDWDTLLIQAGGVRINATSSSRYSTAAGAIGGATPITNRTDLGFYNLSTTETTVLHQRSPTALGGYTSNEVIYTIRLNGAVGTATAMTVKMQLNDGSLDEPLPTNSNNVLGTVTFTHDYVPPPTNVLANVWGAVTVNGTPRTDTQS